MEILALTPPAGAMCRRRLLDSKGITADIVTHHTFGHTATALALTLPEPRRALSSLQGLKRLTGAVNCCLPASLQQELGDRPAAWHRYYRAVTGLLFPGVPCRHLAVLSTGVDIDFLAVQTECCAGISVTALVTAGVKSNALRAGTDTSTVDRHHPEKAGTINTIILTDASLPVSAMAASFITITEAKVAALQDLDIRSTFTPALPATGTGTDAILVISGNGARCQYVGGHTKPGEMMARAVATATTNALKNTYGL